jgi:hypothetical protein
MDTLALVKVVADALGFQVREGELTTGYVCALLKQPAERSGWMIGNSSRRPVHCHALFR